MMVSGTFQSPVKAPTNKATTVNANPKPTYENFLIINRPLSLINPHLQGRRHFHHELLYLIEAG